MNTEVYYGQILALLASLCGAYSSVVYSKLGKEVDSDIIAFIRMCIAFPLMAIWSLAADGLFFIHAPIKDIIILLASGFVGFFVTDMFLFRAYAEYGANETMVVMCVSPILSSVLSIIFFDEYLEIVQYISVFLVVLGVAIVTGAQFKDSKKVFSYGFICAVLAALFQTGTDMMTKLALSDMPHTTSAALRALGGMLGWICFACLKFKGKLKQVEDFHHPKFWLLFVITIIVGTILGTTFAVGSLKYAPAGIATSLKQISPVFILPYDIFILKKRSMSAAAGTLITVLGVVLFFL